MFAAGFLKCIWLYVHCSIMTIFLPIFLSLLTVFLDLTRYTVILLKFQRWTVCELTAEIPHKWLFSTLCLKRPWFPTASGGYLYLFKLCEKCYWIRIMQKTKKAVEDVWHFIELCNQERYSCYSTVSIKTPVRVVPAEYWLKIYLPSETQFSNNVSSDWLLTTWFLIKAEILV